MSTITGIHIASSDGGDLPGPVLPVPEYHMHPGVMFGPRSFFVDRAFPEVEVIQLPRKTVPGGCLAWRKSDHAVMTGPAPGRRKQLRNRLRARGTPDPLPLQGALGLDCRSISPQNWSHFLNIHVPLAFAFQAECGLPREGLTLILPADIPSHVRSAAKLLGLQVQITDAPVEGPALGIIFSHPNIIRPQRREWVLGSGGLDDLATAAEGRAPLPDRVFLARRDTRRMTNQAELEALLVPLGFVTVYAEDLAVIDQFRLFSEPETLVAVHGAGFGPLLYRQPQGRLQNLIEILPCGIISDVFRMMTQHVGCRWAGVRGLIKPQYVRPAYQIDGSFRQFQMEDFQVDPVSVTTALEFLWSGGDTTRAPV